MFESEETEILKTLQFSSDELLMLYFALKNYKEMDINVNAKEKVTKLLIKLSE